jgi:hypothetical protein
VSLAVKLVSAADGPYNTHAMLHEHRLVCKALRALLRAVATAVPRQAVIRREDGGIPE